MNNYILKIVEDFNFNSIKDNNKTYSFAVNALGVVDLGLPSGTMWCECNLGAKNEYEYGGYYAWGELTTKNEYDNTKKNYTYIGNPKQLPPEFDVATQKLGNNYSMPTKELCEELLEYTNNKWIKNYKGSNVNGTVFVSKINGNSIFIPAAGYRDNSGLHEDGSRYYVWTSSLFTDYPYYAWYLYFFSGNPSMNYYFRFVGRTVRPVFKK